MNMHMKKLSRSLAALAAAAVALVLASGAHAQIVTFNTIVANNGNENFNFTTGGGVALSQTFNNVAELNSLTYEFVENGVDTTDQTISAYLVQWNTTTNSVMSSVTVETVANDPTSDVTTSLTNTPLQTFVVPPASGDSYGTWGTDTYAGGGTYPDFQTTLNINQYLDPSLTYAVVLIDTSGANGTLGLPGVDVSSNNFGTNDANSVSGTYGTGYVNKTTHADTNILSMVYPGTGSTSPYQNNAITGAPQATYGFSQIQLVPQGNVIPTPEPRTAAAMLCALFVAVLVGRQLILRRRESEVAVSALAA